MMRVFRGLGTMATSRSKSTFCSSAYAIRNDKLWRMNDFVVVPSSVSRPLALRRSAIADALPSGLLIGDAAESVGEDADESEKDLLSRGLQVLKPDRQGEDDLSSGDRGDDTVDKMGGTVGCPADHA
jgi:hypothetical protein